MYLFFFLVLYPQIEKNSHVPWVISIKCAKYSDRKVQTRDTYHSSYRLGKPSSKKKFLNWALRGMAIPKKQYPFQL